MIKIKKVNFYDNVIELLDDLDGEWRYFNIEEMREYERMSFCECFFYVYIYMYFLLKDL